MKFHDGTPFTADDVVFSMQRVLAPASNMKVYSQGVKEAKKIDDFTVDIVTDGPNPVLLRDLVDVKIMSKAWATKHNVVKPQDYVKKEETYAARNAERHRPLHAESASPTCAPSSSRTPTGGTRPRRNVTEIVYRPIKQDSTRAAALLSGEIDFVLDPPLQDIPRLRQNTAIKIEDGSEMRIIFLGVDQWRDDALHRRQGQEPVQGQARAPGDVPGDRHRGDPPRDDARAFGPDRPHHRPAGQRLLRGAREAAALRRGGAAQAARRRRLSERLRVTLDCPNNRYINDEQICQAVAAMLAQVGIKAKLNAMPRAPYFPKIQKNDTSVYLLGWGVPTFDAL